MTPHGFLKVPPANKAKVKGRTISFAVGRHTVTGTLNDQNLVESVETRLANNVLGDVPVRTVFSGYKDYSGIKFPSHIVQTQAGHPTLDLTVSDVQPNSAAANELSAVGGRPAALPSHRENRAAEDRRRRLVPRWRRTDERPRRVQRPRRDHRGSAERRSHGSHDCGGQTAPAVEADSVRRQHPSALRSLGGVRGYVAAGIPILTHEKNKPYWERILRIRSRSSPIAWRVTSQPGDRDGRGEASPQRRHDDDGATSPAGKSARRDAARGVSYRSRSCSCRPTPFTRGRAPSRWPSPPPFTVNLVENIRRLKLDVERVVHLHGGIDPIGTVVKAAGG